MFLIETNWPTFWLSCWAKLNSRGWELNSVWNGSHRKIIQKNTLVPPMDHKNLDYFLLSYKDQLKNFHNSPNLHCSHVLKRTTYPQQLGHSCATHKEISRNSILLSKMFAKVTTSKPTHSRFKLILFLPSPWPLAQNWKCHESLSWTRGGAETSIYVAQSSLFLIVNSHTEESSKIISVNCSP